MSHLFAVPTPASEFARIRFAPVMDLQSGETAMLIAETDKRFEERAVFGRVAIAAERCDGAPLTPATYLACQVEAVARKAHAASATRPVFIPAPLAALLHADTPMTCDAAIRRTPLCAQEICFEILDAALTAAPGEVRVGVEALRRRGFRVSLDATRSWQASLDTAMRHLLDSIRIDAAMLDLCPDLDDRVKTATDCGMSVIAERAAWRDGAYLASRGVSYGVRPRADA